MKPLPIIACFLLAAHSALAQSPGIDKQALLNYIRKADHVATYCGWSRCECFKSPELFLKQDSLMRSSSFSEIAGYFDDTSHVLKTYAYCEILYKNESLAFNLIKRSIHDSTSIEISDHDNAIPFIQLLVEQYLELIKLKYLVGGWGTANIGVRRISFQFGKPDKTLYNEKLCQLYELLNGNMRDFRF